MYERVQTVDLSPSLLQVAALYGALKVFKFLWIQNDIDIEENFLCYAYCGRNHEIIHMCEEKCSFEGVFDYAIISHQKDLVDYFIENLADKLMENNESIKETLKDAFDDSENPYKMLPFNSLQNALNSMNYDIVLKCLKKITFLIENGQISSLIVGNLGNCMHDLELLKFLLAHQNRFPHLINSHGIIQYEKAASEHDFGAIKLVLSYENMNSLDNLFKFFLTEDPPVVGLILDFAKAPGWEEFLAFLKGKIDMHLFILAQLKCDENTLVKMIKTFDFFNSEEFIAYFAAIISKYASEKMFRSNMNNCKLTFSKEIMENVSSLFDSFQLSSHSKIINSIINK